ncbi:MAG: NAD(P)-dependent oxidoreductase [Candidatus Limnocylindrales bacterium]
MRRPDVWIPERTPAVERERLAALADLHVFPAAGLLGQTLGQGDLLVAAYGTDRGLEVARHVEGLRYIQAFSAGVDSFFERVPEGITLCDASGVHDVPVAEWVLMVILASQRRFPEHLMAQREGRWGSSPLTGDDLVGARVVIVGAGSIGREVEARLVPFGASIMRIARRAREGVRPLSELAASVAGADVVISLLPLTADTRGAIGTDVIAAMRPGALLVNASRGAIVDMAALTEAVLEGRIRVALDVTDPEPLPAGHPLWSAPGAIVTPHVASDVRREEERFWDLVHDQVGRLARGEPLVNVVEDGY